METFDLFSVLTLLGGLAFFLFGMNTMSSGLSMLTGGGLERTLQKMTSNPIKSLLLGAGITIAIQSSSAMTVMLVGFVNSGIMQLGQTVGVIMGSNIGTTLTAWLLSLVGIESSNVFIRLLKPSSFAPIAAFIGIILTMLSKKPKNKDLGNILLGFGILMFGMELMGDAVKPISDMPWFANVLLAFSNPILGVVIGAVFTGLIQSSAASVGILQALSLTGSVTAGMAIPIIMGQNIGTCVTALISSIGVNRNAKRVAAVHMSFNLIGTAVCLVLYFIADSFLNIPWLAQSISPVEIAAAHSVFNVFTTAILLPFTRQLEKIAYFVVRDKSESAEKTVLLDERLLRSPAFAVNECYALATKMASQGRDGIVNALGLISNFDQSVMDSVTECENNLDMYEDKLGEFLIKVSAEPLLDDDSLEVSCLLRSLNDIERIGDHALNIAESAQELHTKKIEFSESARSELQVLIKALTETVNVTINAWETRDILAASNVEPLEEVIDRLTDEIRARHIERLRNGLCTVELGFILTDILGHCERVSDHCSNLAMRVLEMSGTTLDSHEYLRGVTAEGESVYWDKFRQYSSKYTLSE